MADQEDENTKLNPGQADYVQKVNNISSSEKAGTFNDGADKSVPNAEENPDVSWKDNTGQDKTKGPVGSPSSAGNGFNKTNFLKSKGPLTGVIVTIVAALIGITSLTSIPALIVVQVRQVLFGALNDAAPALSVRTNLMLAGKVSSVSNAFNESADGVCGIKCKFGTISETMKKSFDSPSNDFKVEYGDKKFAGRYTIKSLTFPDGHTVTNSAEFKAALSDPVRASAFNKIFNSKTAFLLNSQFSEALKTKLGLDKLSKWSGETKDKAIASFREALGLQGDSAATDPTLKLSPEERARTGTLKPVLETIHSAQVDAAGKTTNFVGGACALYDTSKVVTFADKAKKIAAFAAFAMLFLNLADKIMAGGNPDPAVVAQAGRQLTDYQTNKNNADGTPNVYYGKSATDSVGYQMAAYQDAPGTLSAQDQSYSIGPTNLLASILTGITSYLIGNGGKVGIPAARSVCKVANDPAMAVATGCTEEIVAAAASIETGLGPVISAAVCAGKTLATVAAMSFALGAVINKVVSTIVSGTEIPTLDETTVGPPVVNAMYDGTAAITGAESATYGMRAGSTADIKQYALDTAAIKNQNDAIARYDARNTPLDIQNQYSFLGTFIRNTGLISGNSASIMSYANDIASIIPKSFAILLNPASAASNITAAEAKANLYNNKCQDQSLTSIGISADALCNPSFVMSNSELNANSNTVIDYMVSNNDIDPNSGDSIPGSDYQKYLDNCANRIDPLGETSASITDNDYEWKIGLRCTESSAMLSNFRVYTMDKSINDTMDGDTTTASNIAATGANSGVLIGDLGKQYLSCAVWITEFVLPTYFGIQNVYGDGKDVAANVGAKGYTVDHTPAVHSIVSWPAGGVGDNLPGGHADGSAGHVAIVYQVNADGSIEVEEHNYTVPDGYDKRHIGAAAAKLLTYAHVEAKFK